MPEWPRVRMALIETVRVRGGLVPLWELHQARVRRSAAALGYSLPADLVPPDGRGRPDLSDRVRQSRTGIRHRPAGGGCCGAPASDRARSASGLSAQDDGSGVAGCGPSRRGYSRRRRRPSPLRGGDGRRVVDLESLLVGRGRLDRRRRWNWGSCLGWHGRGSTNSSGACGRVACRAQSCLGRVALPRTRRGESSPWWKSMGYKWFLTVGRRSWRRSSGLDRAGVGEYFLRARQGPRSSWWL